MTSVIVSPVRETALFAKQVATLDRLSRGRFTLGIGVGGREDDFRVTGHDFAKRGIRLARQIAKLREYWKGEPASSALPGVGPHPAQPGGPPILVAGNASAALRRAGRLADGWLSPSLPPAAAKVAYQTVLEAWQIAGRDNRPRFVLQTYFAIGEAARAQAIESIRAAYSGRQDIVDRVIGATSSTTSDIQRTIEAYDAAGVDELIFSPRAAGLDQIQQLAEAVQASGVS